MRAGPLYILSIGGALQLAAVVAAVAEVWAAYRRLRGKQPVLQLLRDWWPPWRRAQGQQISREIVDPIGIADEQDIALPITPWPPETDVESRLRRVEDAVDDHEQRLRRTEERVLASDAELAELFEESRLHHLRARETDPREPPQ